ncbi:Hypothetical predicted protein, partial [Pelobates cultripes]
MRPSDPPTSLLAHALRRRRSGLSQNITLAERMKPVKFWEIRTERDIEGKRVIVLYLRGWACSVHVFLQCVSLAALGREWVPCRTLYNIFLHVFSFSYDLFKLFNIIAKISCRPDFVVYLLQCPCGNQYVERTK